MESNKLICYSNLNSFNSPDGVTEDQMRRFFEKYFEETDNEIVDVIVDRYDDSVSIKKRDGWKRLTEKCAEQKINFIVTPTMQMLGTSLFLIADLAKELDFKHGTHIYTMYEDIGSNEDQFELEVNLWATLQSNQEKLNERALKIRDVFFKATGSEDIPSAVPVHVDYDQYKKAEKVAHDYGLSVRELVSSLITLATVSRQVPSLEEYLFGIQHPKPTRGRPTKTGKQTETQ